MNRTRDNSRKNKTAQIEMMGLMIIVVIISLIIFFVITVVFLKKPQDHAGEFSRQELSSSIIGAMLRTSSGCTEDTTLEDLFIASAKGTTITCNPLPNHPCVSEQNSPEFLKCAITDILDKTLGEFKLSYEFIAKDSSGILHKATESELHIISDQTIKPLSSGSASPYTLPIYPTNEVIELWLCVGNKCPQALTGVTH